MSTRSKAWSTRRIYQFIKDHSQEYDVQTMCRAMEVTRSGYYEWLEQPISNQARKRMPDCFASSGCRSSPVTASTAPHGSSSTYVRPADLAASIASHG